MDIIDIFKLCQEHEVKITIEYSWLHRAYVVELTKWHHRQWNLIREEEILYISIIIEKLIGDIERDIDRGNAMMRELEKVNPEIKLNINAIKGEEDA